LVVRSFIFSRVTSLAVVCLFSLWFVFSVETVLIVVDRETGLEQRPLKFELIALLNYKLDHCRGFDHVTSDEAIWITSQCITTVLANWLSCGDLSENVANQETEELVTAEQHGAETFGEDGSHSVSQEHFDVAPTSFVEPEMDNTLQVWTDAYCLNLMHWWY